MALHSLVAVVAVMATLLHMQLPLIVAECPLDLGASNFTLVASLCTSREDRGKCCRYINAFIAISVSQYARSTGNLGLNTDSYHQVCSKYVSQTLEFYGVPPNATSFCEIGTKVPLNYKCRGRATVTQMVQSPGFANVVKNCQVDKTECRKCIVASMVYLRKIIGDEGNVTLNTCRDATFVSLAASQADNSSAVEFARCFFGVPRIRAPGQNESSDTLTAVAPPTPVASQGPSDLSLGIPINNHHYHLTVVPSIAIGVTVVSLTLVAVLLFLIHTKSKDLSESECDTKPSSMGTHPPPHMLRIQEGPMLRKFTLKETRKATENFTTVIGEGGFGTVYKAQFNDGSIAAIKRINKVSEQADDEICREIELLARLHHRHLVALKGFCIEKQERFLMYEYMENGSLKDHLHSAGKTLLSWRTRIQIAINVANALEYLHFYCNPPLCHRDIKSSNILLDENFVAKVADFGLAHASKDGSICFEPINTDVRGTPGYMDPEYVVTRELTEKSDIYSYGVLLLELVTGRWVITDKLNLVEWATPNLSPVTKLSNLVDPAMTDSFDFDQLQILVEIIKWCIHPEGRCRPSIREVLRLLYECLDPMRSGISQGLEDDDEECCEGDILGVEVRKAIGSKGKGESYFQSAEGRGYPSSSSTTKSYCSRSFLLEDSSN